MSYHAYDHDKLEAADTMRIERTIYFESENADISALTALTVEQLQAMREESAAAEQAIFESLQQQAAAWEQQAGKTLELNKAIEYARTPAAQHTENKWQEEEYRHIRSNAVYQMSYRISENTRYDKAAQKSIPYSYTLSWSVLTNAPGGYRQAHIAGQSKKVFADKAAMEKYLNGRIKAYAHLFTEISPPIPQEYAEHFKVNGQLLPGYSIEGEEQKPPEHATDIPTPSNTEQRKERELMSEQFSVLIDSRSRFETGIPGGAWLPMPTTAEQLHEAMQSVGITADNPQDFFINGFANNEDCPFDVPLEVIQRGSVDELNYLGKLLEMQQGEDKAKFTAAVTLGEYAGNLKDLINLAQNLDCYWLYPTVQSEEDYGYYLIDELDELELPEEAKKYFMYEDYGRDAAINDGGRFTEQGYVYNNKNTFTEWYDGRDVPEEYRIMSYPQPPRLDPEKVDMDAATVQTATLAAEPTQPKPVIPINLTAEKPAEKLKEITDRLEQGITELFDSERYKEYLSVMSKFHNYSFNNTLLIAMQKPDASLIAGFNAWKNQFQRSVKKGEKGIKIIAPSPFKVKKEMEKIDPKTGRSVIGRDGKPVTEEKEITIPAYKVVSVFDVSQTEGRELPDIAVDTLTGDVEQYKDFFAALEKTAPVPIGFEKIEGGAHGYYHLEGKRIALDEGMSELQTLKTAIHEIAHAKLHDIDLNAPKNEQQPRVDRRTREVEAESIAYTVCQHYGLDTSDYSFGYVAGWSSGRELAELKSSLETIRSTAAEIINSIDGHIAELQKEQSKAQEQSAVEAPTAQPTEIQRAHIQTEKAEPQEAAQPKIQEQTAEQEQPAREAAPVKDTFSIYQLKRGDETRDFRFEPYDRLTAAGLAVDPANYDLIYTAPLTPDMTLESIWEKFNIDHPKDFKGHSLSVSDVVVLHQDGQDTAHYVDSIGYKQVPEFLQEQKQLIPDDYKTGEKITTPRGTFSLTDMTHEQMNEAGYHFHHQSDDGIYHIMANGTQAFAIAAEQPEKVNPLKHVEDTVEQNDNNFDGIINNTPTVDELEAKAKAGEQISLTDLAAAIKADKERGKSKEEKPSIRAQLKADKERAKKKPTQQKNHDLEV